MSFIGGIFSGIGGIEAASSYDQAANIEKQNVALEKQITGVNVQQTQRQIYQALGTETADTGAAGMRMMGTGRALMQSSQYQGALQLQAVKTQGIIQENAYAAQSAAYSGEASAAEMGGIGGIVGGIAGIAGIAALAGAFG